MPTEGSVFSNAVRSILPRCWFDADATQPGIECLRQYRAKLDDANGTIIYPKHVHKALRHYLGIENTPGAQRFPFNNTEDFAFFG